jgi:hypothetical protein
MNLSRTDQAGRALPPDAHGLMGNPVRAMAAWVAAHTGRAEWDRIGQQNASAGGAAVPAQRTALRPRTRP